VLRSTGTGRLKKEGELSAGQAFGESAVFYGGKRAVTVRAVRDVTVWTIPKAQLLGLFGQKHTTFKERRNVLMRNSLFRDLREEQIDALSRMVTEKSVSSGQIVYRAGDSADNIYFIVKGSVKLCLGANKTMSTQDRSSSSSSPSKGTVNSLFEVDRVFENSSFGEVETVLGFSGYGSTAISLSPSEGGTQSKTLLLVLAKDLCTSVCRAVSGKSENSLNFTERGVLKDAIHLKQRIYSTF
jgi:CRP-like cAMP-binding protein